MEIVFKVHRKNDHQCRNLFDPAKVLFRRDAKIMVFSGKDRVYLSQTLTERATKGCASRRRELSPDGRSGVARSKMR